MSVINILVQVGFVWGSYLFWSSETSDLQLGDVLFITGSVITFVFAAYNLAESRAHWQNYYMAEREDRIEFWETACFFLAGLIFMIGSFFYWPGIYNYWYSDATEHEINEMEESGEAHGARCFIIGSILFLIASMFNAIGLGMNKEENEQNPMMRRVHYIHLVALFFSQMGSVLFVAGSWMYRPVISSACPDYNERYEGAAQEGEIVAEHACETVGWFGTKLYIIGSTFYLIEALLNFTNSALKHKFCNDGKLGHKEVNEKGSDEEEPLNDENLS